MPGYERTILGPFWQDLSHLGWHQLIAINAKYSNYEIKLFQQEYIWRKNTQILIWSPGSDKTGS